MAWEPIHIQYARTSRRSDVIKKIEENLLRMERTAQTLARSIESNREMFHHLMYMRSNAEFEGEDE
jgi:hypothetical protein